eukprot:Protomagalhaensia_wolfi_Nauph_80__590@NODE_1335_length_1580_cov_17_970149_g1031_i0_p1_GENE_NODE_1335_length_1580_cov_17_970149_g1031_i0NODE_1335_length_1580_cov_17_970149_g1031_i0_p1_ORF_typecomplete_len217_score6_90_NODE_1335_length_1580_cov_17_970149_g1031_i08861536
MTRAEPRGHYGQFRIPLKRTEEKSPLSEGQREDRGQLQKASSLSLERFWGSQPIQRTSNDEGTAERQRSSDLSSSSSSDGRAGGKLPILKEGTIRRYLKTVSLRHPQTEEFLCPRTNCTMICEVAFVPLKEYSTSEEPSMTTTMSSSSQSSVLHQMAAGLPKLGQITPPIQSVVNTWIDPKHPNLVWLFYSLNGNPFPSTRNGRLDKHPRLVRGLT